MCFDKKVGDSEFHCLFVFKEFDVIRKKESARNKVQIVRIRNFMNLSFSVQELSKRSSWIGQQGAS